MSASEVRTETLTIRVDGGKATVVQRRRKVGYETLDCAYICGLLDTDVDGRCWSADHTGPRCRALPTPDRGSEASECPTCGGSGVQPDYSPNPDFRPCETCFEASA